MLTALTAGSTDMKSHWDILKHGIRNGKIDLQVKLRSNDPAFHPTSDATFSERVSFVPSKRSLLRMHVVNIVG